MLQEGYDVYVNEPQPLDEGEEKHILSVFVADEAGLINRVAGVFARRGNFHLTAHYNCFLYVQRIWDREFDNGAPN